VTFKRGEKLPQVRNICESSIEALVAPSYLPEANPAAYDHNEAASVTNTNQNYIINSFL
jgi:hypothetical protein